MKKLFLSLVATMIAMASFAQGSLIATLSHGGLISTFYGTTALKSALENAVDGDAITLSAGQFLASDITKAVTLRGAGMKVSNEESNRHEATIIQGNFDINLSDDATERLVMEGLYISSTMSYTGTINNAQFIKSRFYKIDYTDSSDKLVNCSFIHCRIADYFKLGSNSNVSLVNCIVMNPDNYVVTASNFEFANCVVRFKTASHYIDKVGSSYYKNCVIMSETYGGSSFPSLTIPSSCVVINCIGCTDYGSESPTHNDIFYKIWANNSTNKNIDTPATAFKTAGFDYTDSEMYELTDEAKTLYLGNDDKQVGIYGGNLPYDENPTTPQITKCNVAAKSTADGKLSVDIEVKAAEY